MKKLHPTALPGCQNRAFYGMIDGIEGRRAAYSPDWPLISSIIIHFCRFFHRSRQGFCAGGVSTLNNLIIGIAGGSGSGKTTLALRLKERFGEDEVRLISHDSYYKRHDDLPFEERCKLNYDHPDAFDNALLIYHLQELKAGRAIDCPVYDYSNHNRSDNVQHIEPAPVLIVEGILPFVEPELCAMFDYKIFVDTDADERILRRLVRDVKERGRSLDSVIEQYLTTVKPMHEAFVEPSKRNADIIVPNGGENTTAIEMLAHHIRSLIEKANMR